MPILFHQGIYRPAAKPSHGLPLGVQSVGHYKVKPPFASLNMKIDFIQFFWCISGSGIVEFEGRPSTLKQHQVAIYYPNMRHYWYPDRQIWEFLFLTIDGPFAVSLLAAFGLEAGIYSAGPAPVKLFQKLFRIIRQPTKQAELEACMTAFAILTRTAGSCADRTNGLVNMAVERMHEQFALSNLNVKTLSAALGIRRAVLSVRFHAAMGMPPGAYIVRLRIQNALSLLASTRLTIAAVAFRCGYKDAHYFSRVIRRTTGSSPLQFRKLNQSDADKRKLLKRRSGWTTKRKGKD